MATSRKLENYLAAKEDTARQAHEASNSPFQVGVSVRALGGCHLGTITALSFRNTPHVMATIEHKVAGLTDKSIRNIHSLSVFTPKPSDF